MAANKTTDTTSKNQDTRAAKRAFFVNLFDLSWRLLGAMLLPLAIGIFIDSQRDNGQPFSYAGFAVGMVCGALTLRSVVRKLSKNV